MLTGAAALTFALSIRWLHKKLTSNLSRSGLSLFLLFIITILVTLYYYVRHRWLHSLRDQAISNAASLTTNAQEFDAAVSAGILLIQEVELVSRGYNMYGRRPIHSIIR